MKLLKIFLVLIFVQINSFAFSADLDGFIADADAFFKKNVRSGRVDYAAIKNSPSELKKLVSDIGEMKISSWSTNDKICFYINSYNLLVIQGIINNYPVEGPLKITGFFDTKKYKVAGESITLNTLEKTKLKELKEDPRYHFILVCAANGCPKLAGYAIKPHKLEAELNWRAQLAMRDSYFIRVKNNEKKVYVSEIFKWYRSEFPSGDKGLIDYINSFREAKDKIDSSFKVAYYTYDWKLNKKK